MSEQVRVEFGNQRSSCDCPKCALLCRFMPAALIPADLLRLIPKDVDPFEWAEQHLRAHSHVTLVTRDRMVSVANLVPARKADGSCHWLQESRCDVHASAPYGCAFFDQCRQTRDEAEQRWEPAASAIADDWFAGGLYSQLWYHLWNRNLRDTPNAYDFQQLQNSLWELDANK